jgi:probable addiction module antidote protein
VSAHGCSLSVGDWHKGPRAHLLTKKLHSIETSLNAALRTADVGKIFVAFDAAIHRQKSIKELALNAGLDRVTLHRMFRPERNPSLDSVVKVLRGLGFQFVVEYVRQPKRRPNHFAFRKFDFDPELRSNSKRVSEHLTRAFKTDEMMLIAAAFSDVLRAQENIMAFAEGMMTTGPNLYRAFRERHVPRFGIVVSFLHALGLRLAVKQTA